MRHTWPKCAAANPAGASRLQSVRPVRRVAGSLAMTMTFTVTQLDEDSIEPESPEKTAPLGEVLFREMRCFFHVLPRLDVLNDTLREGQIVNTINQMFRWRPFELSDSEYADLRREVLAHPEWEKDIDETFSGTIQEWSHWALVRSISK